jgi:glutaconate CoA-transferase subunit A
MGLPFLPTRTAFGSDVFAKQALSAEQRAADPRTSPLKQAVIESPFQPGDKLLLLPAIHTEFCVLHVQKATESGLIRVEGQTFADNIQALCADTVIVTAEEIVSEDFMRQEPERTLLPPFAVAHVVHVPFGSHPYAVYNYYDHDPRQLKDYHAAAMIDEDFQAYLEKYVYGVPDFESYLGVVGSARLDGLKADPEYGYSPNLKRRRLD